MTFRPDGIQVAIATINGQITFFNPVSGQQTGNIDGRGDLTVGRSDTDLVMPKKTRVFFTTLSYRYMYCIWSRTHSRPEKFKKSRPKNLVKSNKSISRFFKKYFQ